MCLKNKSLTWGYQFQVQFKLCIFGVGRKIADVIKLKNSDMAPITYGIEESTGKPLHNRSQRRTSTYIGPGLAIEIKWKRLSRILSILVPTMPLFLKLPRENRKIQ